MADAADSLAVGRNHRLQAAPEVQHRTGEDLVHAVGQARQPDDLG
ncbi:hypothetical protein ACIBHY_54665 [Nonomuraea sp. NPDC050547]